MVFNNIKDSICLYKSILRASYRNKGINLSGSESISFTLLLSISTFVISVSESYFEFIPIAIVFGFCYGALTNLFYIRIALVKDERLKSNAFSILGLMSYLGVGLGSFIFSSVADASLSLLFICSSIFPIFPC